MLSGHAKRLGSYRQMWTADKNNRRIELIKKEIAVGLPLAESRECRVLEDERAEFLWDAGAIPFCNAYLVPKQKNLHPTSYLMRLEG